MSTNDKDKPGHGEGETPEERTEIMRRDGLMIGIAVLSLLNGMQFSPFIDPAFIVLRPFAPTFFVSSPLLMFYLTSLLLGVASLLISGVAAALFERATGRGETDSTSMMVWLGAAFVVALPSILALLGLSG
ncbi:MAG: hypothetical protein R3D33_12655 [Hyphomicrobiaceae bacterium]